MSEKEKNNKGLSYGKLQETSVHRAVSGEPPSTGDNSLAPNAEKAFAKEGEKRFVSAGERIHNELTYRGVDLALNAASGIAFTFATSRTKFGREKWSRPLTNWFEKPLKLLFKNPAEPAKWGTKFVSIMFGGTVTIPPIMYLEARENKLRIIQNIDEKIYGKDRVANDPDFAIAYNDIRQEPQKDFGTGMITRFIALAPLFTAALTMPRSLTTYVYDPVANGSKWAAEKLRIKPGSFMSKMGHNEEGQLVSNWDQLHRLIGFDFGLTVAYSFLHEWAYKALSAVNGEKKPVYKEPLRTELPALTQELDEHLRGKSSKSQGEHKKGKREEVEEEVPSTVIQKEHTHHMERVTEGPAAVAQM